MARFAHHASLRMTELWSCKRMIFRFGVPAGRRRYARAALVSYAFDAQLDFEDCGAGGDVKRLAVFVAPGYVAYTLGDFDGAEMLAFGRDDPDAARAGAVDIAFLVDANAVGAAVGGF